MAADGMRRAAAPAAPGEGVPGDSSRIGLRTDDRPVRHDDGRVAPAVRLLGWAAAVAVGVVVVRLLLVQSFVIPSTSMEPTLEVGDRVLVLRLPTLTGSVRRGDVVVFDGSGVFDDGPPSASSPLAAAGRAVARTLGAPVGGTDYVKRVIGLPGERVTCCDDRGRLMVDGVPLDEPYLFGGDVPSEVRFDVVVPPDRLWVMGDHRSASGDSRAHLGDPGGGTVPIGRLTGRVVAVWWPFARGTAVPRTDPAGGS